MKTVQSLIRRVMLRAKKASGTSMTMKQVKGPGKRAYAPKRKG